MVANHPGAVKCHWLIRQPRDPALRELVILAVKLDTCVYLPTFRESSIRLVLEKWVTFGFLATS